AAAWAPPRHGDLVGPGAHDRVLPRRARPGDRPRRPQRRRSAHPSRLVRRPGRGRRTAPVVHGVPRAAGRRRGRRLHPPLRARDRDGRGAGGVARLSPQPRRRVHRRLRARRVQVALPARSRRPRRRAHHARARLPAASRGL
ncbi:MAG: hypothetical protein AVDCRST_MAG69-865, partial [uncultured Solirubrobacteraceae bacterium]